MKENVLSRTWHKRCLYKGGDTICHPRPRLSVIADEGSCKPKLHIMALISFSTWLDRFGDLPPEPSGPGELDSVTFAVTEAQAPRQPAKAPAKPYSLRRALDLGLRRVLWRLRRRHRSEPA
jgi:hypothetical protein